MVQGEDTLWPSTVLVIASSALSTAAHAQQAQPFRLWALDNSCSTTATTNRMAIMRTPIKRYGTFGGSIHDEHGMSLLTTIYLEKVTFWHSSKNMVGIHSRKRSSSCSRRSSSGSRSSTMLTHACISAGMGQRMFHVPLTNVTTGVHLLPESSNNMAVGDLNTSFHWGCLTKIIISFLGFDHYLLDCLSELPMSRCALS